MPPRTLPNGSPNAARTRLPNNPERRPNTPAHTHYYYVIWARLLGSPRARPKGIEHDGTAHPELPHSDDGTRRN